MIVLNIVVSVSLFCMVNGKDEPVFAGEGTNVTVVVGRDATLVCTVENLDNYKVAWLRVDTQTLLTVGPHVITKNHRVAITKLDPQTWALTLRDVRPADGGHYMCQINTEPMITQTHVLQVSVPPDIEDTGSSGEALVREGDGVTLRCAASGVPPPVITWRREDSAPFSIGEKSVSKWSGVWLNLTAVTREMSGAFLCIATNGVPPSVSKRILLRVLCKPSARMMQKMLGGYLGDSVVLQCKIEAYPNPMVYWTHMEANRLQNGSKYQASIKSDGYKHEASLRITNVSRDDIGSYQCHVENALGTAEDDVILYTLATTTTSTTTTTHTTAKAEVLSTTVQSYSEPVLEEQSDGKNVFDDDNYVVVLSQHQMQNLVCVSVLILMGAGPTVVQGSHHHSSLRIHQGQTVTSKQYPFVMLLAHAYYVSPDDIKYTRVCTCSLIQPQWILIAAHCLYRSVKQNGLSITILLTRIIYGDFTMPLDGPSLNKKIKDVHFHPQYKENTDLGVLNNDIALLKTVECFSKIQHVKLSALDYNALIGYSVKYLGAGVTYSIVNIIQKEHKSIDETERKDLTKPMQLGEAVVIKCESPINHHHPAICLAPKCAESMQYSLPGDSGGPLLFNSKIVGIKSAGDIGPENIQGPVHSNYKPMFELYTPISPYLDWIYHVVASNKTL